MEARNFSVRGNRASAQSGFSLSPNIWYDCPMSQIRNGEIAGHYQELLPQQGGLITSPTTEAALIGFPLSGFGSAGSTVTYADEVGGGLVLTEATDNEAVGIRSSTCPFQISSLKGKLWFEMRLKTNQGAVAAGTAITRSSHGWIAGLWSDVALSVVVPLSTANPPIMATTGDFVGFRMPEEGSAASGGSAATAGGVNFSYDLNDSDQTTDAEVVVGRSITTMTHETYINLGFVFDPIDSLRVNSGSPTLMSFVNNLLQTDVKTIPNATTTDFPAAKRLGLMALQRLGASTSTLTTIQWMRCYQLGVPL